MYTNLTKPRFSGAILAKLSGLTASQFLSLRQSGLMIDKPRYTLQDVFFVALCNDFRVRANKVWTTIKKLLETVFDDLESAQNIDFINNEVLTLGFSKNTSYYGFLKMNDPFIIEFMRMKGYKNPIDFKSFCILTEYDESCYINLLSIRLTILNRTKELDLKGDFEKILLSA